MCKLLKFLSATAVAFCALLAKTSAAIETLTYFHNGVASTPLLGRFMGVDPKGYDPSNIHSFNRYAYANNNPNRFVDPDERDAVLANGGIVIKLVISGTPSGLFISSIVGAKGVNSSEMLFQK